MSPVYLLAEEETVICVDRTSPVCIPNNVPHLVSVVNSINIETMSFVKMRFVPLPRDKAQRYKSSVKWNINKNFYNGHQTQPVTE